MGAGGAGPCSRIFWNGQAASFLSTANLGVTYMWTRAHTHTHTPGGQAGKRSVVRAGSEESCYLESHICRVTPFSPSSARTCVHIHFLWLPYSGADTRTSVYPLHIHRTSSSVLIPFTSCLLSRAHNLHNVRLPSFLTAREQSLSHLPVTQLWLRPWRMFQQKTCPRDRSKDGPK